MFDGTNLKGLMFVNCFTVDQKRLALGVAPKFMLPKPGQSGLRPPGFSHLPPARLAAFGFVRSASVSSVSSNQSNDSTHSDPCRSSRECYNSSCHKPAVYTLPMLEYTDVWVQQIS